MESLLSIRDILKKNKFMCKLEFAFLCQRTQENKWGFTGKTIYISSFAFVLTWYPHLTFLPNFWKYEYPSFVDEVL